MIDASGPSFSHLGLFVTDLDRIVDFYTRVMGFFMTDRGYLGERRIAFLSRDPIEHHQIVFVEGRDVAREGRLLNQMSFRLGSLAELLAFIPKLEGEEASNLEPVIHGNSWSLYFRDPESNRVEVFADSEWYINQPIREILDYKMGEDEIRRQTYEFCRTQPGFKPIADWRRDMVALMAGTPAASVQAANRKMPISE